MGCPKSPRSFFSEWWLWYCFIVLNFIGNNFVALYRDSRPTTCVKKTYRNRWIFVQPFWYWRWKPICNLFSLLCFTNSSKAKTELKRTKKICAVCREDAVGDRMWRKWFVKFLGATDILVRLFFVVGLPYAWEGVQQHPWPLPTRSQ